MTNDKKPVRILCLDDEPVMLAFLKEILQPHGYEAVTTSDSSKALTILWTETVDLLIQDIARPDISGFKVYELLKANERLKNIPVVICSGHGESRRKFLECYPDVAYVLEKPVDSEQLLDVVRKALMFAGDKRGEAVPN
jgi:twitching motility two-component system response regulator PilH